MSRKIQIAKQPKLSVLRRIRVQTAPKWDATVLRLAHKQSIRNWDALKEKDQLCGCFSCRRIFRTSELDSRLPEQNGAYTAWCPYCGIDAILGEYTGFPITHAFIDRMHSFWFGD